MTQKLTVIFIHQMCKNNRRLERNECSHTFLHHFLESNVAIPFCKLSISTKFGCAIPFSGIDTA